MASRLGSIVFGSFGAAENEMDVSSVVTGGVPAIVLEEKEDEFSEGEFDDDDDKPAGEESGEEEDLEQDEVKIKRTDLRPLDKKRQRLAKDLPEKSRFKEKHHEVLYPQHVNEIYSNYWKAARPDPSHFQGEFESMAKLSVNEEKVAALDYAVGVTKDGSPMPAPPSQQDPATQVKTARGSKRNNRKKAQGAADGKRLMAADKAQATVMVADWSTHSAIHNKDLEPRFFGSLQPKKADSNQPQISFTPIMHSQVPGFKLKIDGRVTEHGSKKPPVTVFVYANDIQRSIFDMNDDNLVSLECNQGDDELMMDRWSRGGEQFRDQHKQNGVSEIYFSLNPVTHHAYTCTVIPDVAFGQSPRRPEFHGDPDLDLPMLVTEWAVIEEGQTEFYLCPADQLLARLYSGETFSIFRFWPKNDSCNAAFSNFSAWWGEAVKDAVTVGNFPYYRRHANVLDSDIMGENFPFVRVPPPRQLVKLWRLEYNDNGEVSEFCPEKWASFPDIEHCPDVETKSIDARISIWRAHEYERHLLRDAFEGIDEQKQLSARITPLLTSSVDAGIWLEIFLDDEDEKAVGDGVKKSRRYQPAVGTRVEVFIHEEGPFKGAKLNGEIAQDFFAHHPTACILAYPERGVMNPPTSTYAISMTFVDDPTSSYRQSDAMIALGRGVERTTGVDFPRWLLGASPSIKQANGLWLSRQSSPTAEQAFRNALQRFSLNDAQTNAAMRTYTSEEGLSLIWGPPGTGKSHTLISIIFAQVMAGKAPGAPKCQVLANAPTNPAIQDLCKKFNRLCNQKGDLLVILFQGGYTRKARQQPIERSGIADANQRALWTLIDTVAQSSCAEPELWPFYLHNQIASFINKCSKDTSSVYYEEAVQHKGVAQSVNQKNRGRLDPEELARRREFITQDRRVWEGRVLAAADVIFCTNNATAHEKVVIGARPTFLVQDETAMGHFADTVTGAAMLGSTILGAVFAGDHKQQGPPPTSRGSNESLRCSMTSIFKKLYEDPSFLQKDMLKEQRRMAEWIARMVSGIFYGGQLINHPSVLQRHPVDVTLEARLAPLKPYYAPAADNRSLRFAVDISGEDAAYESKVEGSNSPYNMAEAFAIAWYVEYLLNAPVPEGGRQIVPEDFLIITPHKEQAGMIKNQLNLKLNNVELVERIRISTSAKVQGREAPIGLISMVRNRKDDPLFMGFATDARQLCVNMSRPMRHLVVFGNWLAWMLAQLEKAPQMIQKRGKFGTFAKVVEDFRTREEVVSGIQFLCMVNGDVVSEEDDIRKVLVPTPAVAPLQPLAPLPPRNFPAAPAKRDTSFAQPLDSRNPNGKRTMGTTEGRVTMPRGGDAETMDES